jgi:hypothetical protein
LALGLSFHNTVKENAYQKVNSGKDLSAGLLKCFFAEDLEHSEVDWSDQSLDTTKDQGVVCVDEYRYKMAPKTQPAFVEYKFRMDVIGRAWKIKGKVDLITDEEVIVDHKTTTGTLKAPKPEHVFQIGVYALAIQKQAGNRAVSAQVDYYPRGKPAAYSRPVTVSPGFDKQMLTAFDQAAKGIKHEIWAANRTANTWCKRRYCDFWNQCEIDCGGRVPD